MNRIIGKHLAFALFIVRLYLCISYTQSLKITNQWLVDTKCTIALTGMVLAKSSLDNSDLS